jgi:hypothetical protein
LNGLHHVALKKQWFSSRVSRLKIEGKKIFKTKDTILAMKRR